MNWFKKSAALLVVHLEAGANDRVALFLVNNFSHPELRLFATAAKWNQYARTSGVDSGNIYRDVYNDVLYGLIFGAQAETWW